MANGDLLEVERGEALARPGGRFRITTSGYAVACGSNEVGIGRCGVTAAVSGGTFEGIVDFIHGLTSVVSAHLT